MALAVHAACALSRARRGRYYGAGELLPQAFFAAAAGKRGVGGDAEPAIATRIAHLTASGTCVRARAHTRTCAFPVRAPAFDMCKPERSYIPVRDLDIREELGRGGLAVVFRAKWNGTSVAVKRLMEIVAADPDEGDAFAREASIWSGLRHPCIVQFLGVTLFDERQSPLGVVQEYVSGGSLFERLYRRPATCVCVGGGGAPARATAICVCACALPAAGTRGRS